MAGKVQDHSGLVPSANVEGGGSELVPVQERPKRKKERKESDGFLSDEFRGGIRRYWPILLAIFLIIVAFAGGFCLGRFGFAAPAAEGDQDSSSPHIVSSNAVIAQLEKCSELVTAKVYYGDVIDFEAGEIPVISQNSFTMFYKATVSAGVDLSGVTPIIDDEARTITVVIPEATIQSVDVDEDSLAYYDEKTSLLNHNDLDTASDALAEAKADARKDVEELGLLDSAEEQAVEIIEGFLSPFTEDVYADEDGNCYKVVVTVQSDDDEETDEDE